MLFSSLLPSPCRPFNLPLYPVLSPFFPCPLLILFLRPLSHFMSSLSFPCPLLIPSLLKSQTLGVNNFLTIVTRLPFPPPPIFRERRTQYSPQISFWEGGRGGVSLEIPIWALCNSLSKRDIQMFNLLYTNHCICTHALACVEIH